MLQYWVAIAKTQKLRAHYVSVSSFPNGGGGGGGGDATIAPVSIVPEKIPNV